jgi:hypothetical protein
MFFVFSKGNLKVLRKIPRTELREIGCEAWLNSQSHERVQWWTLMNRVKKVFMFHKSRDYLGKLNVITHIPPNLLLLLLNIFHILNGINKFLDLRM